MNEVGKDITEDFHIWGCEWNATDIAPVFDGKIWARGTTTESLKRPMYILINLAVGGQWYSEEVTKQIGPTKPWEVDETTMPWRMERHYACGISMSGRNI